MIVEAGIERRSGLKVEFDDQLFEDNVHYSISVDEERATALMVDQGLSSDEIDKLQLVISRQSEDPHCGDRYGEYFRKGKIIFLYGDPNWKHPDRGINSTFLHEVKHAIDYHHKPNSSLTNKQQFAHVANVSGLLITSSNYVASLGMLIWSGWHRDLRLFFLSSIAAGFSRYGSYILARQTIYSSALEVRARAFAEEMGSSPEWQDIVKIEERQ